MWFAPRCYKQGIRLDHIQFWDGGQPGIAWGRETEESPLLEAVTRERLVEAQQAGKGLFNAVEISGGAVITCTYEWYG
jgi:hypothetical protein